MTHYNVVKDKKSAYKNVWMGEMAWVLLYVKNVITQLLILKKKRLQLYTLHVKSVIMIKKA